MPARKTAPAKKVAESPRQIGDLSPNERNPRKPWKNDKQRKDFLQSLQTFGDLSGIVFNRSTRQLVGGHKRVEEFKAQHSELKIIERLTKADASGTVAYGQVILKDGTRFAYREVEWAAPKEAAANLAANKWGADWLLEGVTDLMAEAESGGFDLAVTGFDLKEIETLTSDENPNASPGQFLEVGANIKTENRCPKCHYVWSGSSSNAPSPNTEAHEE